MDEVKVGKNLLQGVNTFGLFTVGYGLQQMNVFGERSMAPRKYIAPEDAIRPRSFVENIVQKFIRLVGQ